jgi:hypothetical protein
MGMGYFSLDVAAMLKEFTDVPFNDLIPNRTAVSVFMKQCGILIGL